MTVISVMVDSFKLLCWTIPLLSYTVVRLLCFVISLSPGFVRFACYYFTTPNRKCVRYGKESCRQTLDVYSSSSSSSSLVTKMKSPNNDIHAAVVTKPVVVFYTGGAWMIGYKMWGALLARALNAAGIVVVIPDLRNWPWGTMSLMLEDVEQSLLWTVENILEFGGGDPNNVVIVGQSAGGHLVCSLLLSRIIQNKKLYATITNSSNNNNKRDNFFHNDDALSLVMKNNIMGFISLSAPYTFRAMKSTLQNHGLDENFIHRRLCGDKVKEGQNNFEPYRLLLNCPSDILTTEDLPFPIQISHGTMDQTVPYHSAVEFYKELKRVVKPKNGRVAFVSYRGWTHTDAILERPMIAHHLFHKEIFDSVKDWTTTNFDGIWPKDDPAICRGLCPRLLVKLGRFVNPF